MARYIDADKVVKWSYSEPRYSDSVNDRTDLRDFLLSLPTLSPDDLRGVIHCKDCKWCHAGYCEKYDDLIPWGCANKPWEDWFCADGKRRETTKEVQNAD